MSKSNPQFGEVYCPYVGFRTYTEEMDRARNKKNQKNALSSKAARKTHKLPFICKNKSYVDEALHSYASERRADLSERKKISKKGVKFTLGIS